jgi:carbon-monoxide dehydrogenase small subunit
MFKAVKKQKMSFRLNGEKKRVEVYPMARLLDVIREELSMTGTKEGCGEGECGACSVMLEGSLVNSCLVPVAQVEGCDVLTIEGLAPDPLVLHTVQREFIQKGGAQCGICTPGMIMASYDLIQKQKKKKKAKVTEELIRNQLAGNLCRCTGYMKIFDAVKAALKFSEEANSSK